VSTYYATDPTAIRLSVSAVVWEAAPGGALLLMQRSDNGHWGLPGGYVEPGESVREAAAREVVEETGFAVETGRLIGVYSDPATQVIDYGDERVQAVNLCFEARPAGERGEPTTPEETLATGWYAADALPEPFVPIHQIRIRDALGGGAETHVR